jgi:hypothetical protein
MITRGYWSFAVDNNFEKYSGTTKFFYNFGEHKISDGFHSKDANYGLNIYESIKLFKGNNLAYSYINMKSPVYATPKQHLFLSCNYQMNNRKPVVIIPGYRQS